MKYIIAESKIINTVREFINRLYPEFSKGNCLIKEYLLDVYKYYNVIESDGNEVIEWYAEYDDKLRELKLNRKIHDELDLFFGEDLMTYVIEWFNEEFDKRAEYVTF